MIVGVHRTRRLPPHRLPHLVLLLAVTVAINGQGVVVYEYSAEVERIVDGDTVRLNVDLGFNVWRHDDIFRLYGINAAEHATPSGDAATAFLKTLLPAGVSVTIVTTKDKLDKYGRMLATITTADGKSVNDEMVSTGHALPYFGKGPKPVPPPLHSAPPGPTAVPPAAVPPAAPGPTAGPGAHTIPTAQEGT